MPDEIIGTSPALERFERNLPALSKETTPLVIVGERGVGKTFLAAHIHATGPLSNVPMQSLNFAIATQRDQRIGLLGGEPPELTTSRRGILEFNTTIVLKHVEFANPFLQDRLAEALSASLVRRAGSVDAHTTSGRVIFTFRRTIPGMVKSGALTLNLSKLLSPLKQIHLPPLRLRREDVPLLFRHFAEKFLSRFDPLENVSIRGMNAQFVMGTDLMKILKNERFEDNVRDVIAFVRTLAIFPLDQELHNRAILEIHKMALMIEAEEEFSLPMKLAFIERCVVTQAARRMDRQRSRIAHLLGLSERAIGRKLKSS